MPWLGGLALIACGYALAPSRQASIPDPTADDPPIGTRITLPGKDLNGRPISPLVKTLLVFGGSCTGCSGNAASPIRVERSPFQQVVIVFLSTPTDIRESVGTVKGRALIVADPEGKIRSQIRASSAPRFYVIENGLITDIWKQVRSWPYAWTGESR